MFIPQEDLIAIADQTYVIVTIHGLECEAYAFFTRESAIDAFWHLALARATTIDGVMAAIRDEIAMLDPEMSVSPIHEMMLYLESQPAFNLRSLGLNFVKSSAI